MALFRYVPDTPADDAAPLTDSTSQTIGTGDCSFRDVLDLSEGIVVVGGRVEDDAIGGREDPEVAHVRIVGGEQHANVLAIPVTITRGTASLSSSVS